MWLVFFQEFFIYYRNLVRTRLGLKTVNPVYWNLHDATKWEGPSEETVHRTWGHLSQQIYMYQFRSCILIFVSFENISLDHKQTSSWQVKGPDTHGLSEARGLYRAIPAMTLDLGLNGLIRRITLSRFVTSYDEPREPDYRCTGQKRFLFAPRPLSYSRFSPTVAPWRNKG